MRTEFARTVVFLVFVSVRAQTCVDSNNNEITGNEKIIGWAGGGTSCNCGGKTCTKTAGDVMCNPMATSSTAKCTYTQCSTTEALTGDKCTCGQYTCDPSLMVGVTCGTTDTGTPICKVECDQQDGKQLLTYPGQQYSQEMCECGTSRCVKQQSDNFCDKSTSTCSSYSVCSNTDATEPLTKPAVPGADSYYNRYCACGTYGNQASERTCEFRADELQGGITHEYW